MAVISAATFFAGLEGVLETLVAVVGRTAGDRDAALVGEHGLVLAGASAHDAACPPVQDTPRRRTTTPG